jgi:Predicted nucleotide-binding protein containing TIR-like domain/FHA domain
MSANPALLGRAGPFNGISIPLPKGGLSLGREPAGPDRLAFDDNSDLSRRHCTIRFDESRGCFDVIDHDSTNGSYLLPEEKRIRPNEAVSCSPGQLLRVGKHNVFELVATRESVFQSPAFDSAPGRPPVGHIAQLRPGQRLDLNAIRVPWQRFYFGFVLVPSVLFALLVVVLPWIGVVGPTLLLMIGLYSVLVIGTTWFGWRIALARFLGHGIRVGPTQYPQIHELVVKASEILDITPPTVVILQGHGVFEMFVARHFSRRGLLLITSNLLDELIEGGSSRELMFFIGRQLGLIAIGYFDYFFFKHFLGAFASFFYFAWLRRCHLSADRVGLLVAGDPEAAEYSMLLITAGSGVAANTNIQALADQREELMERLTAWIALGLSHYPFMVDRILRLREFAADAMRRGIAGNTPVAIGALPLPHRPLRALPLIIIHGHDLTARLELVNFLQGKFPHVKPVLLIEGSDGAHTLAEKFERAAHGARGALALLTPDDLVHGRGAAAAGARARQNVIIEIGWMWARLGRHRMMLLSRGALEMPSDLSGVEVHRFSRSPMECAEAVRDFIGSLEMQVG